VNIVVSDVMMPEMDGLEFMERVKSDIEFSHIPVILLTAKVTNQSKVQGYELGADAYLDKPFSVDVLLARIENLLQGREKLRESFFNNPFTGAATVALTKSDEEFIKKLNTLVQDNLAESDFNVENMAEHFNMSRASFYRKVKGVLDLTPNEYLRVERLKKAAYLLREEDYKVNEVCYMVGFNSPSYFTKCFQQQFGILPKEFQEQRKLILYTLYCYFSMGNSVAVTSNCCTKIVICSSVVINIIIT
jgi:DNA-binding response OmpR family regulator